MGEGTWAVRGVDSETVAALKVEARRRGLTRGEAVEQAVAHWLAIVATGEPVQHTVQHDVEQAVAEGLARIGAAVAEGLARLEVASNPVEPCLTDGVVEHCQTGVEQATPTFIPSWLKAARSAKGMTQAALAAAVELGVAPMDISRWERAVGALPPPEVVAKLWEVLR